MARTIWKVAVKSKIELPSGAKILKVGLQNEEIFLWALIDPTGVMTPREFRIIAPATSPMIPRI